MRERETGATCCDEWVLPALLLLSFSCSREAGRDFVFNEGEAFGTIYHFTYASPGGKDFREEIEELMRGFSRSLFDLRSRVDRLADQPQRAGRGHRRVFPDLFRGGAADFGGTGGAFDITAGLLVNAWGFGFKNREEITQERIEELLRRTGYQNVSLVDGMVRKEIPEIELDPNAIAKGLGVDVVAAFLWEKGCRDFMVEIGGEVSVRGRNPRGLPWSIGIDKPVDEFSLQGRQLQQVVRLRDRAMATSGNYRNHYVKDGKKYAHTIDPKTGYPVEHNLLWASVLASDCMRPNAYATAFMVMGVEKSIEMVEANPAIEAFLIYDDDEGRRQTWASAGFGE